MTQYTYGPAKAELIDLMVDSVFREAATTLRSQDVHTADAKWWARTGASLKTMMDPDDVPEASRVGEAAGQEYQAPEDPDRSYGFGLTATLDGIEALIHRTHR